MVAREVVALQEWIQIPPVTPFGGVEQCGGLSGL